MHVTNLVRDKGWSQQRNLYDTGTILTFSTTREDPCAVVSIDFILGLLFSKSF